MLQTVFKSATTGRARNLLNTHWSGASRSALGPQLSWREFPKFEEFSYIFVSKHLPLASFCCYPVNTATAHRGCLKSPVAEDCYSFWQWVQSNTGRCWGCRQKRDQCVYSAPGPRATQRPSLCDCWVSRASAAHTDAACGGSLSGRDSDVFEKLQADGFCC